MAGHCSCKHNRQMGRDGSGRPVACRCRHAPASSAVLVSCRACGYRCMHTYGTCRQAGCAAPHPHLHPTSDVPTHTHTPEGVTCHVMQMASRISCKCMYIAAASWYPLPHPAPHLCGVHDSALVGRPRRPRCKVAVVDERPVQRLHSGVGGRGGSRGRQRRDHVARARCWRPLRRSGMEGEPGARQASQPAKGGQVCPSLACGLRRRTEQPPAHLLPASGLCL